MKAVLLVMLASVFAWGESLPADFEFLLLLPFGVGALGLVVDVGGRVRARAAGAARETHR